MKPLAAGVNVFVDLDGVERMVRTVGTSLHVAKAVLEDPPALQSLMERLNQDLIDLATIEGAVACGKADFEVRDDPSAALFLTASESRWQRVKRVLLRRPKPTPNPLYVLIGRLRWA